MNRRTDEIFIFRKEDIRALPERPMRAGLFGKSLEDALQVLLEKYPEVIPGSQIDPSNEDPPRFVLLRREMPVAGWSLDHLFVDQYGILTLVEAKLIQNPESRRDVIGQIIEYAANAREAWGSGRIRQYAAEFWSEREQDLDDVLLRSFPEMEIEEFWNAVENSLVQGRIRLIIASDSIRPEVRRMIEYLNSEMQNAAVLGLELKVYGQHDDELVFVPRIVGQTQAIADRRTESETKKWGAHHLADAFGDFPTGKRQRLQQVLDWALERGCFLESRAQSPTFGLRGLSGDRIFSVSSSGQLYVYFEEDRFPGGIADRDRLLKELYSIDFLSPDILPDEVVSGRHTSKTLWELPDNNFEKLLDVLLNLIDSLRVMEFSAGSS